jgi:hypothetical protein
MWKPAWHTSRYKPPKQTNVEADMSPNSGERALSHNEAASEMNLAVVQDMCKQAQSQANNGGHQAKCGRNQHRLPFVST